MIFFLSFLYLLDPYQLALFICLLNSLSVTLFEPGRQQVFFLEGLENQVFRVVSHMVSVPTLQLWCHCTEQPRTRDDTWVRRLQCKHHLWGLSFSQHIWCLWLLRFSLTPALCSPGNGLLSFCLHFFLLLLAVLSPLLPRPWSGAAPFSNQHYLWTRLAVY